LDTHSIELCRDKSYLRIGDITVALCSNSPDLRASITGAAQIFQVERCEPDAIITARWGDIGRLSPADKVFESGGVWELYKRDDWYCFSFQSAPVGPVRYKSARFNTDFTRGEILINPDYFDVREPIYPLEYPLDELVFLNLLAQSGGIEVHACGLTDADGIGHLFIGQSGAGKTTTAQLWKAASNAQILSDDRIILREVDGVIWMYGTPWHGEAALASSVRVPLSQIYFLRHGLQNELESVKAAAAVSRLFACAFPFFYSRDALGFALRFLERVVELVVCAELRFVPDPSAVKFVRDSLR